MAHRLLGTYETLLSKMPNPTQDQLAGYQKKIDGQIEKIEALQGYLEENTIQQVALRTSALTARVVRLIPQHEQRVVAITAPVEETSIRVTHNDPSPMSSMGGVRAMENLIVAVGDVTLVLRDDWKFGDGTNSRVLAHDVSEDDADMFVNKVFHNPHLSCNPNLNPNININLNPNPYTNTNSRYFIQ